MDKLNQRRTIIKELMSERADLMRSQPLAGEEIECILDEKTDNYLLLRHGWARGKRLYSITLHLRLAENKVHIEQDWTDDFVADLVFAGIAREDLVFDLSNSPTVVKQSELAIA